MTTNPKNIPETAQESATSSEFALKLFSKSVLKQAKLRNLLQVSGGFERKTCLDLGSDNGVISHYLREEGGDWFSGDLTEEVVGAIRSLVVSNVDLVAGDALPYSDQQFDTVVVVDMLEHVENEERFISELDRILKSGGLLVVNTPNLKAFSPLRAFRHLIGQTDEKHGHLRPGYSEERLAQLMGKNYRLEQGYTYSGFFSEAIDTTIVFAYGLLKKFKGGENKEPEQGISKGLVVTEEGLKAFEKQFKIYSLIYPVVLAFSKLDKLIFFIPGFMRIAGFRKD